MNILELQSKSVMCRQSSIKCAYACKRKWLLKYRLGIELRGVQVKESATLGQIYHKFQQYGPGREAEVRAWVRDMQVALMARVDKEEDIDGSMVRLANMLTDLYNKAEAMAHVFWTRFPQPAYLQATATEIDCSFSWNDLDIGGRIDKILQHKEDNSYWIRDHKSTGRGLNTIFGGLAWSIQARLYRLLAFEYLKDEGKLQDEKQVRGFIMDGTVRPGIKLCRTDEKNAKTWNCPVEEAYLRRVKDWYKEQEEKGKESMKSKALIFIEPIWNSELVGALTMMQTLADGSMSLECYPRDITRMACMQYETQCIYHDLCETNPNQWDQLFETKYKIEEKENE